MELPRRTILRTEACSIKAVGAGALSLRCPFNVSAATGPQGMASRPETQIVPVGTLKALGWFYDNSKDIFLAIHNEVVKKTNPAWTALSGWDTATSEETSCWDYVAAGDLERVQVAFRRLAVGERVEGEFRMRTADDRELWVRGDVVGGEDGWLLVILRDVTAERMREAEREETRRVERLISADAGVTIWRYNADTCLLYTSDAADDLLC